MTAQLESAKSSQVATAVNGKLYVFDIALLGETIKECRRGVGPAAVVDIDFEQQF